MGERGRLILVVNPVAGGGRALRAASAVEAALRSGGWTGWDVERVDTRSAEHAEEVGSSASPQDVVAVLSGDGGIARVAAGVRRSGALLAPLPGGRGNDLLRALGRPLDPVAAASSLRTARERLVDVGTARSAGSFDASAGRDFVGVVSIGLDADATGIANATTRLRGSPLYAYAAVRALVTSSPKEYDVEIDGAVRRVPAWMVAVANSGWYGGGMRIAPTAGLDDGLLDVVIIGPAWRPMIAPMLVKVLRGTHLTHPLVTHARARTVSVRLSDPAAHPGQHLVYADGDAIARLPVTIHVIPRSLRILA